MRQTAKQLDGGRAEGDNLLARFAVRQPQAFVVPVDVAPPERQDFSLAGTRENERLDGGDGVGVHVVICCFGKSLAEARQLGG